MDNITIIGVGRLGLCNALSLEKVGYSVLGVDVDPTYISNLNSKTFKSYEPFVNEYLANSTKFEATTSLEKGLEHSSLIFISVPTPNGGGEDFYDHSILTNLLTKINTLKPQNKHFVITCTVMPKFCDQIGQHLLSDCQQSTLSYNPEFIAQGNIIREYENPDMILIGQDNVEAGDAIEKVYQRLCKNSPKVCRMNRLEAEITKLALNGFITTKIAYANMIGEVCDTCNVDKFSVMSALGSDSRIGNKYLKPGYSYGGPCFPRDTKALSLFLNSNNIQPRILTATHESNEAHIDFEVQRLLKLNLDDYEFTNVCYKEDSQVPIILTN